jgi:hypothetical protein
MATGCVIGAVNYDLYGLRNFLRVVRSCGAIDLVVKT